MITAHLPSGYVVGRLWPKAPLVLPAAVLGGVLPDFDMIWFYLVDDRAFHHHRYWVHIPAFWAVIAIAIVPLAACFSRQNLPAVAVFFTAIFVHIILDTIAGGILWHWPWSDQMTVLITIPARYDNWLFNFVFHWVFFLEIAIWAAASALWFRQ